MMGQDNKTEQPTPRRRQKAREKGQVARSRELMGSLAVLTAMLAMAAMVPQFVQQWRLLVRELLQRASHSELHLPPVTAYRGVFQAVIIVISASWMIAALS